MKKLCTLFFVMVFLLVLGFGTSASAYYIDTRSGATIEYDLSVVGGGGTSTGTATFTVDVTSAGDPDWYIGAWNVKLFQSGTPATIETPINITGGTGGFDPTSWEPTDGTAAHPSVSIWGWSQSDGQSGFYDSDFVGIGANNTPTATGYPDSGISLGIVGTTTFQFDFSGVAGQDLFTDDFPFQVAYFGDQTGGGSSNPKNQFSQLSENLHVPEPASMLLLGAALIGLVGIGRKKFFKKEG